MTALFPVRILLTGFGPFPGVPFNVSMEVVNAIAARSTPPGVHVDVAVLPVIWSEAREVVREAVVRIRPHAILHIGVSRRARGFEIETRAFNFSGLKADNAGVMRTPKPLMPSKPAVLNVTLPARPLCEALKRRGLPAGISANAGRYLCNAVLYWSLADAEDSKRLVSFVHIPALGVATETRPRVTMNALVEGAEILVSATAEAVLRGHVWGARREDGIDGSPELYRGSGNGRRSLWSAAR